MDDFPSRFRAVETDQKLESHRYGGDNTARIQWHAGADLSRSGQVTASNSPWHGGIDAKDKASSSSWSWSFDDPESKRRKRVVRYKAYGAEGNIKASIRSGVRWIKNKFSALVHRY